MKAQLIETADGYYLEVEYQGKKKGRYYDFSQILYLAGVKE